MRHIGSLLLALIIAPAGWVLAGIGLARYSTARLPSAPETETVLGLGALVGAGILVALLVMPRLSPIGPTLAGLGYLAMVGWAVVDNGSLYQTLPRTFLDTEYALTAPAEGVAALLAVPLVATLFSPRRWRRYDRVPALYAGPGQSGPLGAPPAGPGVPTNYPPPNHGPTAPAHHGSLAYPNQGPPHPPSYPRFGPPPSDPPVSGPPVSGPPVSGPPARPTSVPPVPPSFTPLPPLPPATSRGPDDEEPAETVRLGPPRATSDETTTRLSPPSPRDETTTELSPPSPPDETTTQLSAARPSQGADEPTEPLTGQTHPLHGTPPPADAYPPPGHATPTSAPVDPDATRRL